MVRAIKDWAERHMDEVQASRARFDTASVAPHRDAARMGDPVDGGG